MSRHERRIKDGVARFLEDGEPVLAAVIAASRARAFADTFERATASHA